LKRIIMVVAAVLAVLVMDIRSGTAGQLAGVSLPDQVAVDGRTLVLNGMGLREATLLRLHVYVAGLYLEARSSDAARILAADDTKRLLLHFVRDVGHDSLVGAWNEGFAKNGGPALPGLRNRVETLNAWMVDVKRGDTLTFTQIPGRGVVVEVKGHAKGTLGGADFSRALWGIWLGDQPPNQKLKMGLLGS